MVAADVGNYVYFAIGGGEKLDPFGVVDSAEANVFYLCGLSFIVQSDATIPRFLDTDDIFLTVTQGGVKESVLEDVGFVDVLRKEVDVVGRDGRFGREIFIT